MSLFGFGRKITEATAAKHIERNKAIASATLAFVLFIVVLIALYGIVWLPDTKTILRDQESEIAELQLVYDTVLAKRAK